MNNMHNIYFTVELRYSLCKTYSKMQNILGYKKSFIDILNRKLGPLVTENIGD